MIILDHVSKHYQTRDNKDFVAVEPTSLEIKQGEIFGLMGYSGAGKSTLLRLINLLERPDTGTVSVCGQELTALNATQLRHATAPRQTKHRHGIPTVQPVEQPYRCRKRRLSFRNCQMAV